MKIVSNLEGDSGSGFGGPRAPSKAEALDFAGELCLKSKIDLLAPECLRGGFWGPKWSRNGI